MVASAAALENEVERGAAADPLTTFSTIYAVTVLLHRLAMPNWAAALTMPAAWISVVLSFVVLWRPGATWAFVLLVVACVGEWLRTLPAMPNHFFFEGLVNSTILPCVLRRLMRDGRRVERGSLFADFAPIVRVELIAMYALAFLHKLNWDFLDPSVSCAVVMHQELAEVVPFVPGASWTAWPALILTLAFEGGIPILLAFRRTRLWGVYAGLVFHWLLSLHPHPGVFSFSAMLFALYFLFLPPAVAAQVAEVFRRDRTRWSRVLPSIGPQYLVLLVFLCALLGQMVLGYAGVWYKHLIVEVTRLGFWPWIVWGSWLAAAYVRAARDSRVRTAGPADPRGLHAAWAVVPLIVLNGLMPYVGLKTVTVFSMFSNLRTEERPNHLFMPQLHLWDFQTDAVEILRSNHQGTRDECEPVGPGLWCSYRGQRVPYFEFKRWTSGFRTFDGGRLEVEFVRNARRQHLRHDRDDALARTLYVPHPWLLDKLMVLRQLPERAGPQRCTW